MGNSIDARVALLQALISGDSYGLELIEKIRASSKNRFILPQALVYPTLRALESDGLLESYDGEPLPERGGRPRRYYRLTAEGRRVAQEDAKVFVSFFRPALGGAR